jgi:hypothetical protein
MNSMLKEKGMRMLVLCRKPKANLPMNYKRRDEREEESFVFPRLSPSHHFRSPKKGGRTNEADGGAYSLRACMYCKSSGREVISFGESSRTFNV